MLIELLQVAGSSADVLVMTRAQRRQHQQAEAELDRRNTTAGVKTTPVELKEGEAKEESPLGPSLLTIYSAKDGGECT